MSYDIKLATACDHRIYKESVTLASDRRSLRVSKPMAASNVDVYASDDLVPKIDYMIVDDLTQIDVNRNKMIVFKNKWKSVEDYFEVSYVTIKNFCPKCVGLDQIDDITYDVKGNLNLVRNEKLLLQNIEKFIVTEIQSNPFHLFIGSGLVRLIGQRISNKDYITTRITQEISTSLQVLKDLQRQYMNAGRKMTPGEVLDIIENINVSFDANDPSILRADITVRAKSGKSVNYTQYLKIA